MKKFFSLLMVAVAICGLSIGCGESDTPPPSTPSQHEGTAPPEQAKAHDAAKAAASGDEADAPTDAPADAPADADAPAE